MKGHWYCNDCEERIEKDAIDDHESRGHHVKGHFRPDRLMQSDPKQIGAQAGRTGDGGES